MGDRANVAIKNGSKGGVIIYTHWGGCDLAQKVQIALAKKWRWNDVAYLTRIIYDEVVKGSEGKETGFGISTFLCDNEHKIIEIDADNQKVNFVPELNDGFVFGNPASHSFSFEEFINLPREKIDEAYYPQD